MEELVTAYYWPWRGNVCLEIRLPLNVPFPQPVLSVGMICIYMPEVLTEDI